MSNTQFAFINKIDIPSKEKLQASIDALDFNLKLDPNFTPFEDEGFSPCELNGINEVGFEIFYEPIEDIRVEDEELAALAKDKDYCISMSWGGNFNDYACVCIISAALNKDFGTIITYEGEAQNSQNQLIKNAHEAIQLANDEKTKTEKSKKLIEKAKQSGDLGILLKSMLSAIESTELVYVYHIPIGTLSLTFSNHMTLKCSAFKSKFKNTFFNLTRYRLLRAKLMKLPLSKWKIHEKESEDIELTEQKESALFIETFESLPEKLHVDKIKILEGNVVRISFIEAADFYIDMVPIDEIIKEIELKTDFLKLKLTPSQIELAE